MRKETAKIASAWWLGQKARAARTTTDGTAIYLHGHKIVWRDEKGFNFCMCGWGTVTTRERLNGTLRVMGADKAGFFQKDGKQYFSDLRGEVREIQEDEIVTIGY